MNNSFKDKRLVDALFRNRFRSSKAIDSIVKGFESKATRIRPTSIKGVRNGNYFRVRIPPRQQEHVVDVPKLPSPTGPEPQPLQSLPHKSIGEKVAVAQQQQQEQIRDALDRLWAFLKLNGPVLIMNAGSLCTLLAFTRSDVLELRSLSVSGSLCFVTYTLLTAPIRWLSVGWTTLFASVNAYKIVEIVRERHSHVEMSEQDEKFYTQHFMPHGITPKQFEAIQKCSQRVLVPKNTPLVKQGQKMEHVYLVVEGTTRASILGRYLTAASTTPMAEVEKEGGNAGAWVGEMSFLESYWGKERGKDSDPPTNRSGTARYTVVAKEDCVVWRWSHAKMEELMGRSSDMRAALTRAMTSAIVGKVINFTVSRTSARPSWQTWLDEYKLVRGQVNQPAVNTNSDKHGDPGEETGKRSAAVKIGRESPA